jgi:hypothetical protein
MVSFHSKRTLLEHFTVAGNNKCNKIFKEICPVTASLIHANRDEHEAIFASLKTNMSYWGSGDEGQTKLIQN